MSDIVKGRGVRVEVGATYGAPIAVQSISNAKPGVVHATAHGLTDASAGYLQAIGDMVQLNGQAGRVDSPATDTFSLQGIDTTNYPTGGAGQFVPVATWLTLQEATAYTIGGGAANKLDTTTLIDVIAQQENGLLAAQSLTFKTLAKTTPSTAQALVEATAQQGGSLVFRITHPDGSVRLAYGEPSIPGEDVQQGAVGTGQIDVSVKGFVLKLAA